MKEMYSKVIAIIALALVPLVTNAQWQNVYDGLVTTTKIKNLVVSNNNIFAGTTTGIFKSADLGSTWPQIGSFAGPITHSSTSLIVGGDSYYNTTDTNIRYSFNEGTAWTGIHALVNANYLSSVKAFTNIQDTTYAVMWGTSDPIIMHSSKDGGMTWSDCTSSSMTGECIAADATNVYVGTEYNAVYKYSTTDHSFTQLDTVGLPIYAGNLYTSPSALEVVNGVLWSVFGSKLFRYDNAAQHWTMMHDAVSSYISSITHVQNTIVIGVNYSGVWYSTDGGTSFHLDNAGLGQYDIDITAMCAMNDTLYIGTDGDRIFKRTVASLGTVTAVNEINNTPTAMHIYPNPAKNVVNISAPENVGVCIYAIDGRLIMQRTDVSQVSTEAIPAGTYIIKMTGIKSNTIQTERLTVIK